MFQPSDLSAIYIKAASGATEAMMRKLVGPPDLSQFNCDPCPRGHDHGFELNTGEGCATCIAIWQLLCDAGICPMQEQEAQPPDKMKKFWTLKDDYKSRNDNLRELINCLRRAGAALAALQSLGPPPMLPHEAGNTMGM